MGVEPKVRALSGAILATVKNSRFSFRRSPGGQAGRYLTAEEITAITTHWRTEKGAATRRMIENIEVDIAEDHNEIASLLLISPTLDRYFDPERKFIHCIGNYGSSLTLAMSVATVCSKIVRSTLLHPLDAVAETLSSFLDTDTFPITTMHFVKGPRVPEAIDLDQDCRLIPYSEALALAKGLHRPPSSTRFPMGNDTDGCGLALTTALRPGTENIASRLEYSGVAEFGPAFICATLSLITGMPFQPFAYYEIIPEIYSDTLPMMASTGSFAIDNVEFSIFPSQQELLNVDRDELVSLVTSFAKSPSHVRQHLLVPLARLRLATERRQDFDRAIDVCTAIEALVGTFHGRELIDRASWLYAETTDELKHARETMKRFYDHRCRIVHGQKFQEDHALVDEAATILSGCIKWLIRNQRIPNWKNEIKMTTGKPRHIIPRQPDSGHSP